MSLIYPRTGRGLITTVSYDFGIGRTGTRIEVRINLGDWEKMAFRNSSFTPNYQPPQPNFNPGYQRPIPNITPTPNNNQNSGSSGPIL